MDDNAAALILSGIGTSIAFAAVLVSVVGLVRDRARITVNAYVLQRMDPGISRPQLRVDVGNVGRRPGYVAGVYIAQGTPGWRRRRRYNFATQRRFRWLIGKNGPMSNTSGRRRGPGRVCRPIARHERSTFTPERLPDSIDSVDAMVGRWVWVDTGVAAVPAKIRDNRRVEDRPAVAPAAD
jgi:hypothetical protein